MELPMIDSLLNSPAVRMLEQTVSFTEQRHEVLLADIANSSTPGYVQRDLSVAEFQGALQKAVRAQRESFNDTYEPASGETVKFQPCGSRVVTEAQETPNSVAF